MTNDGADGNGLQYGFLKKMTGCQFFKVSSLGRKSLKFCKNVVAVSVEILQEIAFYHLVTVCLKVLIPYI